MTVTLSSLISLVRGIAVDKDDGSLTLWTDAEVAKAVNMAKNDLFSRRPEAFCTAGSLVTSAPADLDTSRTALKFVNGETSVVFQSFPAAATGSILISVNTSDTEAGSIFYFGDDDSNYIHGYITDGAFVVDAYDSGASGNVQITSDNDVAIGSWVDLVIEADGTNLTLTVFGSEQTVSYDGDLLPGTAFAYLGYANVALTETYFGPGSMSSLSVLNGSGTQLLNVPLDDGSGAVAADSVGGYDGDIHQDGGDIDWETDDEMEMAHWAEMPICFLAASILMSQRSKDTYYRKASEEAMKKYLGSI